MKNISTDMPFTTFSIEADKDYILARLISQTGSSLASRTGYFGQQACEKYLKAILVQEIGSYPKTHDLLAIAEQVSRYETRCGQKDYQDKLKIFDDFREVGRYGGEAAHDPHAKSNKNIKTAGVMLWQDSYIHMLDELVWILRGNLNFEGIESLDYLKALQDNNEGNFITHGWRLNVPLRKILTAGNKYFS